ESVEGFGLGMQVDDVTTSLRWARRFANPVEGSGGSVYGTQLVGGELYVTGALENGTLLFDHSNLLLAKFNAATGALRWERQWLTFGFGNVWGRDLDVDSQGNSYVVGSYFDLFTFRSWIDGSVGKLDAAGAAIRQGAWVYGSEDDRALAVDLRTANADSDVYVAGWTRSDENTFTPRPNLFQRAHGGDVDGFLVKFAQPL